MKSLFYLLLLSSLTQIAVGQESTLLPKDETGKYTYYEVVNSSRRADSLKRDVVQFIAQNSKELKIKRQAGNEIAANGKLVIRKSVTLLSHPSGEVMYQFNFETAEGKYRFWLSNFQFIPYYKDRYGNFVPSTNIGVPLENEPKKSNADQWEDYRMQSSKYAAQFAKRLKTHLENKKSSPMPPPVEKVISKTW